MDYKGVKREERGWASHFCCSDRCQFHRSTLLEYNDVSIVVSTIGRYMLHNKDYRFEEVGFGRYFETMVFYADDSEYKNADVERDTIYFECPDNNDPDDEIGANDIHEKVVDMFVEKLKHGMV